MAANSKFDLCTQATALLGLSPITSFSGSDRNATAGRLYDAIVLPLIETYPWRFARVIPVALNRLTEVPVNNWTYYYQLPSDIQGTVHALFNSDSISSAPFKHWERIGQMIATNETAVWIHHHEVKPIPEWPEYFKLLCVYALASAFAMPMKESEAMMKTWDAMAFGVPEQNRKGGQWAVATGADARGSPSTVQRDNLFIDCR